MEPKKFKKPEKNFYHSVSKLATMSHYKDDWYLGRIISCGSHKYEFKDRDVIEWIEDGKLFQKVIYKDLPTKGLKRLMSGGNGEYIYTYGRRTVIEKKVDGKIVREYFKEELDGKIVREYF